MNSNFKVRVRSALLIAQNVNFVTGARLSYSLSFQFFFAFPKHSLLVVEGAPLNQAGYR
jgi:hypothetical protein